MERWLKELLTNEDLKKLDIPNSCLPIHTGLLPRENGEIKKDFSHLPFLKRLYIEKTLFHLYSNFQSTNEVGIVIFTWVIGDGLGDYFVQIETANLLYKELPPSSKITLISLHPTRMLLPSINLDCKQFFVPYEESATGTWDMIPPVIFSEEILSILRSASVILQIPTYFPETKKILEKIVHKGGPVYELIGEGGWGAMPRFSPASGFRSLGLRFFEQGLFLQKIEPQTSLNDLGRLGNKRLLAAFLEGQGPGKIFLAYLREFSSVHLLLETLLKQNEENLEDLSFCVFPSEELISKLPSLVGLLEKYGIGQVKVFYEESFLTIPIKQQGKVLKIIQAKKMDRSDYQILLLASDSLVGCRGDGSLSETLSAGKIPFLDFPLHKKPLLEGLLAVATYHLSENHETCKYLKEFFSASPNSESLGVLAREPRTQIGFNNLFTFLEENYSANDFIKNLTNRAICHYLYPQMAVLEKAHLDTFLHGEKSAYEALLEVKNEIKQLVLS